MKKRIAPLLPLALLLLASLAAACAPATPAGPQPPEIAYGQELCESCGMLIDDPQFAAASVLEDGQARKFDDTAEMIMYHLDHPDQAVAAYFVHDYESQAWIRAETAFYVQAESAHSPMGSGLAAFEKQAEAEAFAREHHGLVMSFDEMRAYVHATLHI